jgi:8-oxoguanine deaminase
MSTLLVKNTHTLVTMDEARQEIPHASLLVRDNLIEQLGPTAEMPHDADETLDLEERLAGSSRRRNTT